MLAGLLGLGFGTLGALGCTCNREAPATTEQAPKQPSKPVRSCTHDDSAVRYTLRAAGGTAAPEQQGLALPFAVELGRVAIIDDGYAVPYLSSDGSTTQAAVALVPNSGAVRVVALGELHGTPAPPQIAASGEQLVVALNELDASGGAYRVGRIALGAGASVEWLTEVDAGTDDSPAFDIAVSSERAVLVWDQWDKAENASAIWAASVPMGGGQARVERRSPAETDAERPRLVARRGGFWLAWTLIGQVLERDEGESHGVVQALEARERFLQFAQLDVAGNSLMPPITAKQIKEPVLSFDLSSGHDGSLLVAYRAAFAATGGSGGLLGLLRVHPDGSMDEQAVEAQRVGMGVPSLLFDPDPQGGAPHAWLTTEGSDGKTYFAALSPMGTPLEALASDRLVVGGDLLGSNHGALLLAEPHGRDLVLSQIRCLDRTPQRRDAGM